MIDPELKKELDSLNTNLVVLQKKREGLWYSFLKGIMGGFGSIVGVAIALLIAGWILNSIGVIPAFKEQAKSLQQTLDEIKRVR